MNTPSTIIPNYRALVRHFEKPMQHGDGRRFLTNPAIYGQPGPGEMFGNVVFVNGCYYVAGPGFTGRESDLQTAAVAGNVAHFNRRHAAPAQHLHKCRSQDEAHAQLWALVVEHYGIADAAEQVAQVQADNDWEQSPAGQAAQAQAQAWLNANAPGGDELGRLSDQIDAAHEANGNDPTINRPDDWIPDYPDDNEDREEYPEHPGDEQHDYPEDDYPDAEAEALGDLYNSQFED